MHQAFLSLGSNIQPEANLPKAIDLLSKRGEILNISSVWETEAVGSTGPNFLNACVLFSTPLTYPELKDQIAHPIENLLGRKRTEDKNAARTIDIDIVLFDDLSCDERFWKMAFVVIPLAEIYPGFRNPLTQESLTETAARLRQKIWMKPRPDIFIPSNGSHFRS